jgi:DNA-directed RNA polymerase specialized sigma24 family protein
MQFTTSFCSPAEVVRNAQCLLRHIEAVRWVLWRKGFSEYAIDQAVTAVYLAAMPYITGRKPCPIENRRAWVLKVAFRAACHATEREIRCHAIEPAILAATVEHRERDDKPFDICHVLSQLTERQRMAVELCILGGRSYREAAKCMRISVGTLSGHLSAGKKRLAAIVAHHEPHANSA